VPLLTCAMCHCSPAQCATAHLRNVSLLTCAMCHCSPAQCATAHLRKADVLHLAFTSSIATLRDNRQGEIQMMPLQKSKGICCGEMATTATPVPAVSMPLTSSTERAETQKPNTTLKHQQQDGGQTQPSHASTHALIHTPHTHTHTHTHTWTLLTPPSLPPPIMPICCISSSECSTTLTSRLSCTACCTCVRA